MLRKIVAVKRVVFDAFGHFNDDDGWAMASHLAVSSLMALFPFLIFVTTLAGFLGADALSGAVVNLIFDTWPDRIAAPVAAEVRNVLTVQRGGFLTVSVIATAFFASNGVEALRTSLNRAYRVSESRGLFYRRAKPHIRTDCRGVISGGELPRDARAAGNRIYGKIHALVRALSDDHGDLALCDRMRRHRRCIDFRAFLAAGREKTVSPCISRHWHDSRRLVRRIAAVCNLS